MSKAKYIIFILLILGNCLWLGNIYAAGKFPDDYVFFTLSQYNDKFEGESEGKLLGNFVFKISIDINESEIGKELDEETLISLVRNGNVTGTLTAPDLSTSDISYEIVDHRGKDEIYMKSPYGYFLWEYVEVEKEKIEVAFYLWYTPPVLDVDLEIIEMTKDLLADKNNWHKQDDRVCSNDFRENRWSLFCALAYSSFTKTNEYNHHNTAIQTARFVIDDLVPDHGYEHTLKDFNNAEWTTYEDIMHVLELSKERINLKLSESSPILGSQ